MGPNGSMVYVVNGDSTVTPRTVRVARTSGELAVIASGVKPGEQVVTDGQMRLAPGAKVEIKSGVGGNTPRAGNTGTSTADASIMPSGGAAGSTSAATDASDAPAGGRAARAATAGNP